MMDWNSIMQFIDSRLLIVVACCWVLGYIFKQTPGVPDWTIIYLVTLFALGFTVWLVGLSADSMLQGLLCGAVAVYGNQLVKQARKGAEDERSS